LNFLAFISFFLFRSRNGGRALFHHQAGRSWQNVIGRSILVSARDLRSSPPDDAVVPDEAEGFYAVHRARPFFSGLVDFMSSGPVMIQVLEGENAVALNRELMGATDPQKAASGTIRADFAESIDHNAVHGSDALETATQEITYFFPALTLAAGKR
jgi:nucleoside diphosphate kinase